ncbi:hypothetical protein I3760_09G181500 [Carya illinoinensis]|nr:hypothetical protein I3760_09G181500 [Carya illinoinensis]
MSSFATTPLSTMSKIHHVKIVKKGRVIWHQMMRVVATWNPSLDGYFKYLVDSELVFDTEEHIFNESSDVAYTYFRKNWIGTVRRSCKRSIREST